MHTLASSLDSSSSTSSQSVVRSILCDPQRFSSNFNRFPFEVTHRISESNLFDVDNLIELSQRVEARRNPHRMFGDAYSNIGEVMPGMKVVEGKRSSLSTPELLRQIEQSQAWVILEHVEREEGYREVLQECICDLLELSGKEVLKRIKWFDAILFVTSPHRITHYHIDRECAWLLQLRGEKEIHLFDKYDKDIVPDEELERFWKVDNGSGTYKPQYEDRAIVFPMRPGTGVHIPVNCPHWLKNGNSVSVSMNVNFQFRDEVWGNIFKANYYLRKLGIEPATPGLNPMRDRLKSLSYTAVQTLAHRLKGKQEVPDEAIAEYRQIQQRMESR